jgi:hypothetical protein
MCRSVGIGRAGDGCLQGRGRGPRLEVLQREDAGSGQHQRAFNCVSSAHRRERKLWGDRANKAWTRKHRLNLQRNARPLNLGRLHLMMQTAGSTHPRAQRREVGGAGASLMVVGISDVTKKVVVFGKNPAILLAHSHSGSDLPVSTFTTGSS